MTPLLLLFPFAVAFIFARRLSENFWPEFFSYSCYIYIFELLGVLVYYQVIDRWLTSSLRNLPHPKDGDFLLGNAKRFIQEPWGFPETEWEDQITEGLYRIFVGPLTIVIATSANALTTIFGKDTTCVKPQQIRYGLSTTIGNGLVTAEGAEHKAQRKMLNPVFRGERGVRTMVSSFFSKSLRLRSQFKQAILSGNEKSSAIVDVSKLMMNVTFDMIMKTTFGLNNEENPGKEVELLQAWKAALLLDDTQSYLEAFCEGVLPMFVSPIYTDWLLKHTRRNQKSIRGRQTIRDFSRDQIRYFKSIENGSSSDHVRANLVEMMLAGGLSDESEMVEQLMTFLAAGHETTAAALTWALYAMSKYPDVQSKLREEITQVVGRDDTELTADQMDSMQYLHGFVMEVLRLWPSIMLTVREPTKDTVIDGTVIPRGQMIMVPIYAINRSKRYWGEDAQSFKPERWTSMSMGAGSEKAWGFMTFLNGTRICIGKEYSIRSMKAVLISLLGTFSFHEAVPGWVPELRKDLACRPQGGMNLLVKIIR